MPTFYFQQLASRGGGYCWREESSRNAPQEWWKDIRTELIKPRECGLLPKDGRSLGEKDRCGGVFLDFEKNCGAVFSFLRGRGHDHVGRSGLLVENYLFFPELERFDAGNWSLKNIWEHRVMFAQANDLVETEVPIRLDDDFGITPAQQKFFSAVKSMPKTARKIVLVTGETIPLGKVMSSPKPPLASQNPGGRGTPVGVPISGDPGTHGRPKTLVRQEHPKKNVNVYILMFVLGALHGGLVGFLLCLIALRGCISDKKGADERSTVVAEEMKLASGKEAVEGPVAGSGEADRGKTASGKNTAPEDDPRSIFKPIQRKSHDGADKK